MENENNSYKEIKRAIDTMARIEELRKAIKYQDEVSRKGVMENALPGTMATYLRLDALDKIFERITNPYYWDDTPSQSVSNMLCCMEDMYHH